MGQPDFNFSLDSLKMHGKPRKQKAKQEVVKSNGLDAIAQAMQDFPDKLRDDNFLTAYAHSRIAARNKRIKDKEEKGRMDRFLKRAQSMEEDPKKVLLYQIKSRDFHYIFWEMPNGSVYKEIIVKPGLKLVKK